LAIATSYGVTGGLFQLVSHTLSKALLFLAAGYMIYQTGSKEISALEGISKKMPLTCLAFTIGAFSLVGLPFFAGFSSKFLIVRAALATKETYFYVLVGLALFGTVIEGAYFFRVIQALYFKAGESNLEGKDAPITALIPMFVFVIMIVVLGLYPKLITDVLNSAASEFLNRLDYIGSVLG
jgi:formate hydrogenlyase subunit 3/multisubunit Na+/H+ antiporter MnhD subunit